MEVKNIWTKIVNKKPDVSSAFIGQGLVSSLAGVITVGNALEQHAIDNGSKIINPEAVTLPSLPERVDGVVQALQNAPNDPKTAFLTAIMLIGPAMLTAAAANSAYETALVGKNVIKWGEQIENARKNDNFFRVAPSFGLKNMFANVSAYLGGAALVTGIDYTSGPSQVFVVGAGGALIINSVKDFVRLNREYHRLEEHSSTLDLAEIA